VVRRVLVETGGLVVYTPGRDNLEAVNGAGKPSRKHRNRQVTLGGKIGDN
jgi:hypothetical protein